MSIGFKATLFAGALTLSSFAPAFAAAPLISNMPDVTIGDLEDSTEATDNNLFVFTDAFTFGDFVVDADTTDSQLMWSFGEYDGGLDASQYTINGKPAVNVGDAAIASDEAANNANAQTPGPTVWINQESETASFRDVILSPPTESAPYDEPAQTTVTKLIRYYVSDGTNVAHNDAFVSTADDTFDTTTPVTDGYSEVIRDGSLNSEDWVDSGIAWSAVSNDKTATGLSITVQPTFAKSRFFGWMNPALMDYDAVTSDSFVRGKFYIYTDVSVLSPINQVPNFRLRLTHEAAVNAAVHFELAQTGTSDPGYEPFYQAGPNGAVAENLAGYWMRPADNGNNAVGNYSPTPSLYRVDFDPVDVPAAAGSKIGALMESYAVSDNANGTLHLTEVVLGTYDALSGGDLVWHFNSDNGVADSTLPGGAKEVGGGGFNHEPVFTPGYLQNLYFEGVDAGGYFDFAEQADGTVLADTDDVGTDVFGIGLVNFESTANVDKLRIAPGKLYHTRFYATSSVPTSDATETAEIQGAIRFRFQTGLNTVSYLLDMTTLAAGSLETPETPNADEIAAQALPGIGSLNPDTEPTFDREGEDGGWYSVVVTSPMDLGGIRNDVETLFETDNNVFFNLSTQPGPGEAGDSSRDVILGVDLIQAPATLNISGTVVPFGQPNQANVRISAIEVYEYPSIDDGGFDIDNEGFHQGSEND